MQPWQVGVHYLTACSCRCSHPAVRMAGPAQAKAHSRPGAQEGLCPQVPWGGKELALGMLGWVTTFVLVGLSFIPVIRLAAGPEVSWAGRRGAPHALGSQHTPQSG